MTKRPSTLVLILANLGPMAGVLLFGWSVMSILILYWAESVIIGIINVLRMVCSQAENPVQGIAQLAGDQVPIEVSESMQQIPGKGFKLFVIIFFIVHYGGFCFGHLSFLLGFFSGGPRPIGAASSMLGLWQPSFWIAAGAIFCSHLYSFFTNYIRNGEYERTGLMILMFRPYGRIVVMHVAVIFGAIVLALLQSSIAVPLILIALKIVVDLRLHEKERRKLGAMPDSPAPA